MTEPHEIPGRPEVPDEVRLPGPEDGPMSAPRDNEPVPNEGDLDVGEDPAMHAGEPVLDGR